MAVLVMHLSYGSTVGAGVGTGCPFLAGAWAVHTDRPLGLPVVVRHNELPVEYASIASFNNIRLEIMVR
jgi:hypothetical protein